LNQPLPGPNLLQTRKSDVLPGNVVAKGNWGLSLVGLAERAVDVLFAWHLECTSESTSKCHANIHDAARIVNVRQQCVPAHASALLKLSKIFDFNQQLHIEILNVRVKMGHSLGLRRYFSEVCQFHSLRSEDLLLLKMGI
jgi:hypothetical protein